MLGQYFLRCSIKQAHSNNLPYQKSIYFHLRCIILLGLLLVLVNGLFSSILSSGLKADYPVKLENYSLYILVVVYMLLNVEPVCVYNMASGLCILTESLGDGVTT